MNREGCSSSADDMSEDHSRAIVHIDIDCFYAQVEMIKNPHLKNKPLGIQQKNIVVTSNYIARASGIYKCMLITDAMKLCPDLILVKGEDLQPYRQMSKDIFALLQTFKCPVEKLGMDENFIDVTSLITNDEEVSIEGHLYSEQDEKCDCGCERRLAAASHIAKEIRTALRDKLNITSCAGIAHNKLLAKLIGPAHKPDQQTTIFPAASRRFMSRLDRVQSIPGIGTKTAEALNLLGLVTVSDLQNCDLRLLNDTFSADIALKLKRLSLGIDRSEVKTSGRPLTVGLEDSFKIISIESEAREKFEALLTRLLNLLEEDGRRPTGIKVTLRRQSRQKSVTHRETRHCTVSSSLFQFKDGRLRIPESSRQKLLSVVMKLFHKLVDLSKPFHITLLGLAFTKFQELITGKGSIANYFMNDLSVQSVLNLQSDTDSSINSMDCSGLTDGTFSEKSESETEPSPKKVRRTIAGIRRHLRESSPAPSPSKLRVADLHLNACDAVSLLRLSPKEIDSDSGRSMSPDWTNVPPDIDLEVFGALPSDIRQDLRSSWKRNLPNGNSQLCDTKDKGNSITRYFIPNKR